MCISHNVLPSIQCLRLFNLAFKLWVLTYTTTLHGARFLWIVLLSVLYTSFSLYQCVPYSIECHTALCPLLLGPTATTYSKRSNFHCLACLASVRASRPSDGAFFLRTAATRQPLRVPAHFWGISKVCLFGMVDKCSVNDSRMENGMRSRGKMVAGGCGLNSATPTQHYTTCEFYWRNYS